MRTTTTQVHRDTVEFIRLGYHGAGSLNFTVDVPNFETFAAGMSAVGGYNEMRAEDVVASFRPIWDMASNVEVGRDASFCLYVTLPFWSHQRHDTESGPMREKYTAEQRQEMAAQVIAWARTVRADVVRVWQFGRDADPAGVIWGTGEHPYRIRIWWD